MNMTCPEPRRIALVTGGSGGIGRAICERLAKSGHHVIVHFRKHAERAEEVCELVKSQGGTAETLGFDVADREQTRETLRALSARLTVSVLVNNAGKCRDAMFPNLTDEAWDSVLTTSLDGFFHVTQPLVMSMVSQRWGRIINISSIAGTWGNKGQVNYSAAKAGVIGASKALALELARRRVTVNVVAPGFIETEMLAGAPIERLRESIPMQRIGRPEEVAAAVNFLASEEASYITGQVLTVGGGLG